METGEKKISWEPRSRVRGVDEFMVQRVAAEILKEIERSGWTQGEADLLPKYIAGAIKQNSEQLTKMKPFTVCGITQSSL